MLTLANNNVLLAFVKESTHQDYYHSVEFVEINTWNLVKVVELAVVADVPQDRLHAVLSGSLNRSDIRLTNIIDVYTEPGRGIVILA